MAVIRYTFTGTLELAGALHIGSGGGGRIGDTAMTDATVIRDSRGHPYIPGSSLRGVVRAAISQFLPTLYPEPTVNLLRDENGFKELKKALDVATIVAQQENGVDFDVDSFQSEWLTANLSSAERLFGTVYWSSPLLVRDLHLQSDTALEGEIRHGVGIDRDTGAAKDAVKYDFEVLPAGAKFDFWMRCDIPHYPAAYQEQWTRMLALGLRLLEVGELTLGGRAARGIGQVQLTNLTVSTLDTGNRGALLAALVTDNELTRSGTRRANGWAARTLQEVG